MCFVEDHGILKGANAYDFCVIWGMPLVATAQLLPNVRDGELYLDRYEQALITSTLSEDGNKEI